MNLKVFFITMSIMIMSVSIVSASTYYEQNYTITTSNSDNSNLQIQMLRYEPYPVVPGEYFNLYIKVQCTGGSSICKNVVFKLNPSYPFSLDSSEDSTREVGTLTSEPIVLEYKVRVSDDAVEGENEIGFSYGQNSAYITKYFNINIKDVQTNFDAIVQDYSDGEISIAIANIGENDAASLIVRIPKQNDFYTTNTNAQMLGNLDAGDYTVVGFSLLGSGNILQVELDYTDAIGERRSKILNLTMSTQDSEIQSNNFSSNIPNGESPNGNIRNPNKIGISLWVTLSIILVIAVSIIFYKRQEKNKKSKSKKVELPDWMKKAKGVNKS